MCFDIQEAMVTTFATAVAVAVVMVVVNAVTDKNLANVNEAQLLVHKSKL
jgi:hypothetical protein